jgi:CelD/BcsL family acetyltransferase involved in cellulose biosynthesis
VQIKGLPPLDRLEPIWRDLEARAKAPFFLSWNWIGAWLAQSGAQPALLVVLRKNLIVGLGLIGRQGPRFGLLHLPRIHLNQAGVPGIDCVCIEFNDLLVDQNYAMGARTACLAALADCSAGLGELSWREMCWSASPLSTQHMPVHPNLIIEKRKSSLSPYVDLDRVRENGSDLYTLSANTRRQIRRAIRLYQAKGDLRIKRASTKEDAFAWLEELQRLHQARWTARGKPGAFARPFFNHFLQKLIEQGLGEGVVDVLRVSAGQYELGYLFNFVYRGCVSNYQSGFRFEPHGYYKPGLVAHVLAVQHYSRSKPEIKKYSFLEGASQYKKSLSTNSEELCWYVYRPRSRFFRLRKMIAALANHQNP